MSLSNNIINIISIASNKIHERILRRMRKFKELTDNEDILLFLAHFISLDYLIKDNIGIVENSYPEFPSCEDIIVEFDQEEAYKRGIYYHFLWGAEVTIGLKVVERMIFSSNDLKHTHYEFSIYSNNQLEIENNIINVPLFIELRKFTDNECIIKRSFYTIFESENLCYNTQVPERIITLLPYKDIELFRLKISSLVTNNSVEFVKSVLNQFKNHT